MLRALVCLVAGALLPLAFSPFEHWVLAWFSIAVLFRVWLDQPPRAAALLGFCYGLGAFGVGVWWVFESFKFSNLGPVIAAPLTIGFIAFLSLYPALSGWLVARCASGGERWRSLLLWSPGIWVATEWLRGTFLTGFTWLQLGYSQVDGPLVSLIPVGGIYGASLAVAIAGGAVALLTTSRNSLLAIVALALCAGLSLIPRVGDVESFGEPFDVVLVQGNISQDQKWRPEMREPTLQRYVLLTSKHWDAPLIIWPETAIPGEYHRMSLFVDRLRAEAKRHGASVLVGAPVYEEAAKRSLNSVFLVGVHSGRYDKRHLVPFGEYLPFGAVLRPITNLLRIPVSSFSAGSAVQPLIDLGGYRLATFICYEIAFGAEVIESLPQASLLITVSNDAWFGDSIGPHQHLQMARARAIETGRYVLRATNTGVTAVIDPRGAVVRELPQFQAGAMRASVSGYRGSTVYVQLGDAPALSALLALILLWGSLRPGHRSALIAELRWCLLATTV